MFTGIVRERGRLVGRNGGPDGAELVVEAPETAAGANVGDSVALDGVCLTVTDVSDGRIAFHAVAETLRRSTYFARTSTSRLTSSPGRSAASVVAASVCGTSTISTPWSSSAAIVSETPWTAIEPFSTQ